MPPAALDRAHAAAELAATIAQPRPVHRQATAPGRGTARVMLNIPNCAAPHAADDATTWRVRNVWRTVLHLNHGKIVLDQEILADLTSRGPCRQEGNRKVT